MNLLTDRRVLLCLRPLAFPKVDPGVPRLLLRLPPPISIRLVPLEAAVNPACVDHMHAFPHRLQAAARPKGVRGDSKSPINSPAMAHRHTLYN